MADADAAEAVVWLAGWLAGWLAIMTAFIAMGTRDGSVWVGVRERLL